MHSRREIAFARRVLSNLLILEQDKRQPKTGGAADNDLRDKAMGENLAWLAKEYYPDRKIIVWAASRHLMREASDMKWLERGGSYAGSVPMGQVIYLLGGCQGSLYMNGSSVYIAGRTTKADLARIEGRGQVCLERSDLPSGKHKISDLIVIVAKHD
jgi:hypothetical protein